MQTDSEEDCSTPGCAFVARAPCRAQGGDQGHSLVVAKVQTDSEVQTDSDDLFVNTSRDARLCRCQAMCRAQCGDKTHDPSQQVRRAWAVAQCVTEPARATEASP